jgi:hypothetical protein
MSTLSNRPSFLLVASIALAVVAGRSYGAEGEIVVNPQKRQASLEQAKGVLTAKTLTPVPKDPFHPEVEAQSPTTSTNTTEPSQANNNVAVRTNPTGPRTERDLLQTIATSPSLKPSGFFVLGGEPTLVFGQKRVKAGGSLTITFEGSDYTLEIVSINRPNFTLRLNREEFTRPIK